MNIVFVCGLFPNAIKENIEIKSKGVIQYAAHAVQTSIVKGLDLHVNDLQLINLPYIGSYPVRYKEPVIKTTQFSHRAGAKDVSAGFNNIALYKFYSRYASTKKQLRIWADCHRGKKVILIYAIHTPFIRAAIEIKRIYEEVDICLIVPDLPKFMGGKNTLPYRVLRKYQDHLLKRYLPSMDAFVVLTKYMAEALQIAPRPWICIEGIYDDATESVVERKGNKGKKAIMYSGTLSYQYGIQNLLDAFRMTTGHDYSLWICGDGEARDEIKERAASDSRIKYYGQIPRDKVLLLQRQATVLINPRTSNGEYTKYSFPSKIIEYLASGTPAIMHRLPGVPEEYYDYCYIAEQEDALGLSQAIRKVCDLGEAELSNTGEKARKFILNEKNAWKQTGKIMEMIERI